MKLHTNDLTIKEYAKKFNTNPAIIIGRLQHNKRIPYYQGREYLTPVVFEE